MSIFPFFKKKEFFSAEQKERIVVAIRSMERQTSGEIRVYVEEKNPFVDPLDRAAKIFYKLKMQDTDERNAVLLYIATKHKELALFGDEGIFKATGAEYWNNAVRDMISKFDKDDICEGVVQCIKHVGRTLCEKFPYDSKEDKNELPDDIVFGN